MRYAILIMLALLLTACSIKTYTSPEGVKVTSGSFIYCPEASVTRVQDGNRTVDMMGETSGVGAAVQSLGHDAAEVFKP